MKRIEAEKAIREILEQIDDDQLPKPTIDTGALGLRTLPDEVEALIRAQINH